MIALLFGIWAVASLPIQSSAPARFPLHQTVDFFVTELEKQVVDPFLRSSDRRRGSAMYRRRWFTPMIITVKWSSTCG